MKKYINYIKHNYNYLLFSFFLLSILAWFAEIAFSLIDRNKFVLPGAWYGPYCPIYGLTFLLLLTVFVKKDKTIFNVMKIAIIVTITEYVISFISDIFFNHIIWDYSNMFMNINGRVCLKMSLLFTIAGIIGMYVFLPFSRKIYKKINKTIGKNTFTYINIFLSIIMIVDMIVTIVK